MPSYTTNLNLTKSTVGGDTNVWGGHLNGNADTIDGIFADAGNGTSVGLNVGSGKTLTVAGTANFTGTTTFSSSGFSLNSYSFVDYSSGFRIGALDDDDETLTLKGFGGSTSMVLGDGNITVTGSVAFDTSTLKVDATNNKVGIGTASPAYALDILNNAGGEVFNISSDGGSNGVFIRMDTDNSSPIKFGMDENNGHFQYFYNGVKKFEAKNNGDILLNGDGAKIFMQSPNGTEYYLSVDNSGNLVVTSV